MKVSANSSEALPGVGGDLQDHDQARCQHEVATPHTIGDDGKFPRLLWHILQYTIAEKAAELSLAAEG